ncbi:sodium- and chloride-dependent glycine transporter 1 isoform X2 [Lingula anatina]|uniref:Transporter n=1 Tax=Lingula anatina TaxID=7574 RepID=A0A1S3HS51_LINAN|nr:sodium- and chloride-dependent glycine transporter 1 isoform X2 [Lingula anatina]|eukprot:XP_013387884.1 sodium- and chloride-dependent glycine transporter 1 isoform X2 [Lingula anatina]
MKPRKAVVCSKRVAIVAQIINDPTYTHREDDNNYIGDVSMDHLERMVWSRKLEFILSCLGYAVGLGNLWRFPYMCYRNGGGAFFIPYLIMLLFCGFPLFYLEISLGQFASLGPLSVWKVSPLFKGVGYGIVTVSLMVSIYYNMIIGWSIFYLFASMQDPVPWSTCDNWWNTAACTMDGRQHQNASNNSTIILNSVMGNISLNDSADVGDTIVSLDPYENVTQNLTYVGRLKSSSEEYFYNYVLGITDDISDFGGMQWYNVGCLCLAWLLVFLALRKGIKTSGKVVYFTAIFPYVVLVILLIRGVSLDGAVEGIKFFLIPKWERLRQAKVWNDAAIQVFYSLGSCFGTLITLASYNKFHNNCYKDAVIVCVGNTLTSVLGGVVIFSILGYMAHVSGTTVDKVAQEGSGLAFVVYPEVVAKFPVSPLWAILFFIMLLTLGLDSQFGMIETLVTAILEEYPKQCHKRKTWVILGVCIVMFILGLPLCTKGGMYWLHLMDLNAAGWSVLILGLFECLVIGWVYGYNRFADNIQMMIGKKPSLYWRALWQFVTPVIIMFILVFSWVDYSPAYYDQYEYPFWANLLGGAMTCLPLVPLPVWMLYAISKTDGPIKRRIQLLTQPAADWGPGPSIDEDIVAFLVPQHPLLPPALHLHPDLPETPVWGDRQQGL